MAREIERIKLSFGALQPAAVVQLGRLCGQDCLPLGQTLTKPDHNPALPEAPAPYGLLAIGFGILEPDLVAEGGGSGTGCHAASMACHGSLCPIASEERAW